MVPAYSMLEGASPYGALNMAGNVWEWVEDYYFQNYCNFCRNTDWDYLSEEVFGYQDQASASKAPPPKNNPTGPSKGHFRVLRGGSWFDSDGTQVIRSTYRYWLRESERYVHTGFRCASGPPRKRAAYVPPTTPEPLARAVSTPPVPVSVKKPAPSSPMLAYIGDVYFDYNTTAINKKYAPLLDNQIEWLRNHPEQSLLLIGYCDDRGSEKYNYNLGIKRALSIRSYLLNHGADSTRLGISSKGESSPFCFLSDSGCRASNRRTRLLAYNPGAGIPAGLLTVVGMDKPTQISHTISMVDQQNKQQWNGKMSAVTVYAPKDIAEFRGLADVDFIWKPVSQAAGYRYVLSRDHDFRQIIFTSPMIPDPSYEVTFLDYGTYYFKVEAMGSKGSITGSSPVRSFIIAPERPSELR